jgi:hypothetical protein
MLTLRRIRKDLPMTADTPTQTQPATPASDEQIALRHMRGKSENEYWTFQKQLVARIEDESKSNAELRAEVESIASAFENAQTGLKTFRKQQREQDEVITALRSRLARVEEAAKEVLERVKEDGVCEEERFDCTTRKPNRRCLKCHASAALESILSESEGVKS